MEVHNTDIAKQLKTDTSSCVTLLGTPQIKKPDRLSGLSVDVGILHESAKMQDWLSKRMVKSLQDLSKEKERSDEESRAARVLYSPLLETEHTFVKDLDEFLLHEDMLKQRKKELLHKQWNDHVFEPIRRQILKVIDGQDWSEVDRRKRELHRQYLEYVNRKGFVFLETMDKGEYYAQALNAHRPSPIKIVVPALRDPLLSQGRARSEEEQTILRCMTGSIYTQKDINQVKLPPMPLVPLGRHGTDTMQWNQMPLGNIDSTPRLASRLRQIRNKRKGCA